MIRHAFFFFVPVAGIAEIDRCITAALPVLPNQMDFFISTEVLSTVCVLCLKETTTLKKKSPGWK